MANQRENDKIVEDANATIETLVNELHGEIDDLTAERDNQAIKIETLEEQIEAKDATIQELKDLAGV